jgi:hypothetical protein
VKPSALARMGGVFFVAGLVPELDEMDGLPECWHYLLPFPFSRISLP